MEESRALEAALFAIKQKAAPGGGGAAAGAKEAEALLETAKRHLARDAPQDAVQPAKDALVTFQKLKHEDGKEEALSVAVTALVMTPKLAAAGTLARDAVESYETAGDKRGKAGALKSLAFVLNRQRLTEEAAKAADEMLDLCEELQYARGRQESLQLLLDFRGTRRDGIQAAHDSLQRSVEAADKAGEVAVLHALVQHGLAQAAAAEPRKVSKEDVAAWILRARGIFKEAPGTGQARFLAMLLKAYENAGDLDSALKVAKELVQIHKEAKDEKQHAQALCARAGVHISRGEMDEATRAATKALVMGQDSGNRRIEVDASLVLVRMSEAKGELAKALEAAGEAIDVLRKMEDSRYEEAELLRRIADMYVSAWDLDSALEIAHGTQALHQELRDSIGEASLLLHCTAAIHGAAGRPGEALTTMEAALALYRAARHKHGEAEALYQLARLLYETGSYDEALLSASKVLSVYVEIDSLEKEAEARHMVAHVQLARGEPEAAQLAADAALAGFRKQGNREGEAAVLETLAQVHMALEAPGDAQRVAEEAQRIWVILGEHARSSAAAQEIANIQIAKKEFKACLKAARATAASCNAEGNEIGEATALLTIANVRLAQGQDACPTVQDLKSSPLPVKRLMEALLAAKEALALFRDLGDSHGEAAALQAVAKVYRLKFEPLLAIENAKQAAVVCKAVGDGEGLAKSLMLEATTYFLMTGMDVAIPDGKGGTRLAHPREEVLCAAAEAQQVFQALRDSYGEDSAMKVIDAAYEHFPPLEDALDLPPAAPDKTVFVDLEELDPLRRVGFRFKDQKELDHFQSGRRSMSRAYSTWPDGLVEEKLFGFRLQPDPRLSGLQSFVDQQVVVAG